jgi:hypothetical protein
MQLDKNLLARSRGQDGGFEASVVLTLNEKSKGIKERLHSEDRKKEEHWNRERGSRTANKHGETEATEKSNKQFQISTPTPRG